MAQRLIDLTGQRFGKLVVIERAADHIRPNGQHDIQWCCKCDCGNERIAKSNDLKRGDVSSCGCSKYEKSMGLEGQRFGKLTALEMMPHEKGEDSKYLCQCDCGNQIIVRAAILKNGTKTHCGCIRYQPKNIPDLIGKRFGMLTVLYKTENHKWDLTHWMCQCDCGNEKEVTTNDLTRGKVKSCGCLVHAPRKKTAATKPPKIPKVKKIKEEKVKKQPIDLTGQKFGMLTVLRKSENKSPKGVLWVCRCDCGNIKEYPTSRLRNGTYKSCGCLTATRGGATNLKIYHVWDGMLKRCENPTSISYKNYGGRGIKVCDEWHDFDVFKKWADESGYDENASRGKCTLERIDGDGNYCPENCTWIDMKQQCNHRRSCHYFEIDGITHTMKEWAKIYNIKYETVQGRLQRGWNEYDALTLPLGTKRSEISDQS
nr:MAG TPA: PVL ORF-50-like family [Caudoviricetes sp.]